MFILLVLRNEGIVANPTLSVYPEPRRVCPACTESGRSERTRRARHFTLSFEGAAPISASSLFAAKRTKLTPLFSYSSALFKKECLPKPFAINLFRTLLQNTRGGGHILQAKSLSRSCSSQAPFRLHYLLYIPHLHKTRRNALPAAAGTTSALLTTHYPRLTAFSYDPSLSLHP